MLECDSLLNRSKKMNKMLIPESWLVDRDAEIRALVGKPLESYAINGEDCDYGRSFRYFVLFSDCSDFILKSFAEITRSSLFYNKFYWFARFSNAYMKKHGFDVGLEQQQFQMLENQEGIIDLEVIGDCLALMGIS